MARRSTSTARIADVSPPDGHNRLLTQRRLSPSDAIDRTLVTVNLAESPLAWLARRGHLTVVQLQAGERLRTDFMRAGQAPRVTMRWDATPGTRGAGPAMHDPTTATIAAKARFEAAVAAAGPGLSDILWRVVCNGDGLETAERAMGWPARAGKLVLVLALDRLVTHYRL